MLPFYLAIHICCIIVAAVVVHFNGMFSTDANYPEGEMITRAQRDWKKEQKPFNRIKSPCGCRDLIFVAGVKLLEMANKRKRKRVAPSRASGLVERLIKLKVKCNFSVKQLQQILDLYQPSEAKSISKLIRKQLREDYSAYRLHGCSQCEEYIWIASENQPCDVCQNQDGRSVQAICYEIIVINYYVCTYRYDSAGNPVQEVFYFPLLDRLAKMYEDKEWRQALAYPDTRRRRAAGTRSDYFDGKIYKRLRASAGQCDHFIALAHCADAVAANKRMSRSILPVNLRCVICYINYVVLTTRMSCMYPVFLTTTRACDTRKKTFY